MNFAKWIHVKIQDWKGLLTVRVADQVTVTDFKTMLGLSSDNALSVPTRFLPLPGDTVLYDYVNEFDTVRIEN